MEIIQAIQEQELALFKSVQGTLFHLLFENQPMPVIVSAIAAELGLTPRAVEGRLYRIRKGLQNKLGGDPL